MKNIALITLHTPTANNYHGASALPYHLIAFRPNDINVEIWSFNINYCNQKQIATTEKELGVKIHLIPKPKWLRLIQLALARLLLPKPLLGYLCIPSKVETAIKDYLKSDDSAVWIYGEDISNLAVKFGNLSIVVTTPDCEAMYYYRVLEMTGIPVSKIALTKYALMYHRYAKFASQYPIRQNIVYHLVGEADALFLKKLNPKANVVFLRHPHYDIIQKTKPQIDAQSSIRLLIAGRYDFYMSRAVDEAITAMKMLPPSVIERYEVTFLGKDWEVSCEELKKSGYKSEIKKYVDDYASEISSHHIQLTPIAVGTGTKGKVLDAFANGLLVIGTPLGLENIAAVSGQDCIQYTTKSQLILWLERLAKTPSIIKEMALSGQNAVLKQHSRELIAHKFFSLFKENDI